MAKPRSCLAELLAKDLAGKTFVVNGGNSGIGLVTVSQLERPGTTVVLA